ncbi:MAG: hypothetical protein R2854_31410 [Caldilineaceae bacterium]
MSQHIGDMENLETLDARLRAVDHMQAIFRITPTAVACDLHPGYSTRWGPRHGRGSLLSSPCSTITAHIAAVMAEHGLDGTPVIGFAFDGTGYGCGRRSGAAKC